jgi:probable phosphoglycerate mutase
MKTKIIRSKLHNRYFVQRHGDGISNELGIIVSSPEQGKRKEFGLTELGISRVENSAKRNPGLGPNTIIVSSPFSRTKGTAKIMAKSICVQRVKISHLLRERNFGVWEGTANTNYEKVWADDQKDPNHRNHKGESVNDVLRRFISLIAKIENDYVGKDILLETHGDTAQIGQCFFLGIDPRHHRELKHLATAEIRRLF